MDNSKEYIKMCDCPEIQELWKPILGDILYVWFPEMGVLRPLPFIGVVKKHDHTIRDNHTWLPRHDQLQEMIDLTDNTGVDLFTICNFYGFCQAWNKEFLTMEQLWLGFVMNEKFNKQWKNEKWEDNEKEDITHRELVITAKSLNRFSFT